MNNLSEKTRNRLLRRVDWRFLLNNPTPEKSALFCSGLLAKAVQLVSAQSTFKDRVSAGECDLAVSTNPSSDIIRQAWQVLRPGGSLYTEWYSLFKGGSHRIRQRLEAAGFIDVVCYWSWPIPLFSSPLFWLPLDAPQVIDYFLASRESGKNPSARFQQIILRTMWGMIHKLDLLAPLSVIAHRPSDDSPKRPSDENLAGWHDDSIAYSPNHIDTFMWTGGKRAINKVILYQFTRDNDKPQFVVKFPRIPEAVEAIIHEAQVLQALSTEKISAAKSAPKVLFLHQQNGMAALGETILYGQPLYASLQPENAPELAHKVTDWLISLAQGGQQRPRAEWWDRLVKPVLHDFELSFQSVIDETVLTQCRDTLNQLGDLPLAFEHRDCSPWNLQITPHGDLAVLDWESAEVEGLPGLDLIYFLTYLAFFLDGAMKNGKYIESYRITLNPSSITGRINSDCWKHYCESTGIDFAQLHSLRLLTWLIHARSEALRMEADESSPPSPSTLRHSLFYTLILEELHPNILMNST